MVFNTEYQWGPAVVTPHKLTMMYGNEYVWFTTGDSREWNHILFSVAKKEWVLLESGE